MSTEIQPRFLYKILPSAPPSPIPSDFPLSELDKNDGFVHLSKATQVPGTADLFFTKFTELWVLKLLAGKFEDSTKWENGFPHLYGNFGSEEVESAERFQRPEGKEWKEVMASSTWLV